MSQSQVFSLLSEFKGLLLVRHNNVSATQAIIISYQKEHNKKTEQTVELEKKPNPDDEEGLENYMLVCGNIQDI